MPSSPKRLAAGTRQFSKTICAVSDARWPDWHADADEFRHVRVTGGFLHDKEVPLHGLLSPQRGAPVQGFYLFTPLRLAGGAQGGLDAAARANAIWKRMLRDYEPPPIDEGIAEGLREYRDSRLREIRSRGS